MNGQRRNYFVEQDMIYDERDIRCLVYGILYVYCDT